MWLDLLKEAVEKTSCAEVARQLTVATGRNVSRTTISLVVASKYPAKTDKIAEMVLNTYGKVDCPHLAVQITLAECRSYHEMNVPTSSPRAMKHWRECQSCPNNSCKGKQDANSNR
jgi:hypothetical protein